MTTQQYSPKELLQIGDRAREEEPVLWAILRSRGGTRFIALLLGMPPVRVDREIDSLVREGVLLRAQNGTPQLNRDYKNYDMYLQVKEFYQKFELGVHQKYSELKWDVGHFAGPVAKQIELGAKAKPSGRPTEKQTALVKLIRDEFETEVFKSIDFARAQGYKGSTRATANYLNALKNKGLLENVGSSTHGSQLWRLMTAGVEWLEHGRWDDSAAEPLAGGRAMRTLRELGEGATTQQLAEAMGISRPGAHKQLTRLEDQGIVYREQMPDGSNRWLTK
jgi:DNA-binding transcriptional ArsR family regulator